MDQYAIVEFSLEADPRQEAQAQAVDGTRSYRMEIRSDSPSDQYWRRDLRGMIQVPFDQFNNLNNNPKQYSQQLTDLIFNPMVRGYLDAVRREVEQVDRQQGTTTPIRMIINLDESAGELQSLRWEALQDYRDQSWLVTKQDIFFSRCLISTIGKRPSLRQKSELTAIIAVANPKDLADPDRYSGGIGPISADGEVKRATDALQPVLENHPERLKVLARLKGNEPAVSIDALAGALKEGVDIFFLACHGGFLGRGDDQKPFLLLENPADGNGDLVAVERLIDQLKDITENKLPRLVVLASCESSGSGTLSDSSAVLQAVGPMLAGLGIPAVIAMQGKISMETVKTFIPSFFEALIKLDGQVDQALATARSRVKERPDAWMPVLYLGLKEGRLWNTLAPTSDPLEIYLNKASEQPVYSAKERSFEIIWKEIPFRARALKSASEEGDDLYNLIQTSWASKSASRFQRAVLLGSAGQGKSVAMRWLLTQFSCQACQPASIDPGNKIVPIFFSLTNLHKNDDIEQFAVDSVNRVLAATNTPPIDIDQLRQWGQDHHLLFLIDDLEELITRRNGVGVEVLTEFLNGETYASESFLISCRSSSYQNQLGLVDIIEMLDLNKADVEKVLTKQHLGPLSPEIEELARNRSMLRLILEVKEQNFQTQGELVQEWIERTLDLEDTSSQSIDDYLVRRVLGSLAFEMLRTHSLSFSEDEVVSVLNTCLGAEHESYYWRDFLKVLSQKALTLNPQTRMYSFTERLYGDYFAAEATLGDEKRHKILLDNISDYWWRDMLEILVGLEPDPTDFFYDMIDRDALVAALCIRNAAFKPDSPVYSALIDGLVEQMDRKSASRRKEIIDRIVQSKHPRVPEVLLRRLHHEWSSKVLLAIARGLEHWKDTPGQIQMLIDLEANVLDNLSIEAASVSEWLKIKTPLCQVTGDCMDEQAYPEALGKLEAIMNETNNVARLRGMAAISLGLSSYRRAGNVLLDLIQKEETTDFVAWCAVDALAEFPHPDVRARVYDLLMEYRSPDFKKKPARYRARLIYLLGFLNAEISAREGNMLGAYTSQDMLQDALVDPDGVVRGFAISAWVRLNYKDAQAEAEKLINTDNNPLVLRKAAEALAQIGTRDSIALLESKRKLPLVIENQTVRSAYRKAIHEIEERLGI